MFNAGDTCGVTNSAVTDNRGPWNSGTGGGVTPTDRTTADMDRDNG